ncbi:MAG: hypothetical protein AAGB26_03870 [Planctomycetota bacterium]
MQNLPIAILLMLSFIALSPQASADETKTDGPTAAELAQAGKYAEALDAYEARLKDEPENVVLLYNTGLMGYLAEAYERSAKHWLVMEKIVGDDDTQLKEKLIQVMTKLGKDGEVEERVDKLHELRKTTKDKAFQQKPHFCRDQFVIDGTRYMVFQFFDFPDAEEVLFKAYELDDRGNIPSTLNFWSPSITNKIAKEVGDLKEGQRLYHIDHYKEYGSKVNHLHTKTMLDYAAFKEYVYKVFDE